MINTSNEYNEKITGSRKFLLGANISLSGGTVLAVNDTDIVQGGMEFEDSTSGPSSFQIGAAIINKHILTLSNYDGRFDPYEFTDATVRPRISLQLSETVESLNKGVFTVDEPNFTGSVIILECLDNMHKFEKAFSEVTLSFPTTAGNALQVICTYCGVSLATTTFFNFDYIIQSRPDDSAMSCLDMVSYIAQVAGDYARCNVSGALELKWYDTTAFESGSDLDGGSFDEDTPYSSGDDADGGNFTDYNSGDSFDGGTFLGMKKYWHFYDFGSTPTIGVDDIVITGIRVENTSSERGYSALYGTEGYVISISNNPLIQSQSDAQTIANSVGAKIVGMRFRQFSASILSNPAVEAGDPAYLSVRGNRGFNTYQGYVTNLSFKVNSRETIQNNAESPSRNSSVKYSESTKTIVKARKQTEEQITAYDLAVQQLTNLITNGFGLFKTEVEDSNGGIIYYMHDKQVMDESLYRWFMTSGGMIEQKKVDGAWTTVSAVDNEGNALYNVITARGIVADWIRTGSLVSQNGKSAINLDDGTFNLGGGKLIWNGINLVMTGEVNADSGQIGPFALNDRGLFGQLIEIYEDAGYPFMWFTKPGDSGWGSNNSGRANFEPSAMVVRDIKNGIETDISVIARDDTQGITGKVQITRSSLSSGNIISRATLKSNGLTVDNYENGVFNYSIELNENGLNIAHNNFGGNIFVFEDDTYVSGIGIRALYNKVIAIEQKLAQHGIT